MSPQLDIHVLEHPISKALLASLVRDGFGDMVKYVVDLERGVIAIGGQLHADAEAVLLESGSRQENLWGANYYPGTSVERSIEYTSLINIRPADSNPGMEIVSPAIRDRVREITHRLIGRGEAL